MQKKLRGMAGNMTAVTNNVNPFYMHNFGFWSQFALRWKDVRSTVVKYLSPREIFSLLRNKAAKSQRESLLFFMDEPFPW